MLALWRHDGGLLRRVDGSWEGGRMEIMIMILLIGMASREEACRWAHGVGRVQSSEVSMEEMSRTIKVLGATPTSASPPADLFSHSSIQVTTMAAQATEKLDNLDRMLTIFKPSTC